MSDKLSVAAQRNVENNVYMRPPTLSAKGLSELAGFRMNSTDEVYDHSLSHNELDQFIAGAPGFDIVAIHSEKCQFVGAGRAKAPNGKTRWIVYVATSSIESCE